MNSPRSPPPVSAGGPNAAARLFEVFLRLRPSSPQSTISESRFLATTPGHSCVYVTPPPSAERSRSRAIEKFSFTRIFDEQSGQREVFEETVLPLLEDAVVRGRDGTLATLGVTGSGKVRSPLGARGTGWLIAFVGGADAYNPGQQGREGDYADGARRAFL